MEITLNIGDNINIPENCDIYVNNNTLTIKERELFNDGDILRSNIGDMFIIFENYRCENLFDSYYNTKNNDNTYWNAGAFRHATEEEKQTFFNDLKAKGLYWNTKTKTLENTEKRAKKYERYLYINPYMDVVEATDEYNVFDNKFFEMGNYYLLSERDRAERDAQRLREFFRKRTI